MIINEHDAKVGMPDLMLWPWFERFGCLGVKHPGMKVNGDNDDLVMIWWWFGDIWIAWQFGSIMMMMMTIDGDELWTWWWRWRWMAILRFLRRWFIWTLGSQPCGRSGWNHYIPEHNWLKYYIPEHNHNFDTFFHLQILFQNWIHSSHSAFNLSEFW